MTEHNVSIARPITIWLMIFHCVCYRQVDDSFKKIYGKIPTCTCRRDGMKPMRIAILIYNIGTFTYNYKFLVIITKHAHAADMRFMLCRHDIILRSLSNYIIQ